MQYWRLPSTVPGDGHQATPSFGGHRTTHSRWGFRGWGVEHPQLVSCGKTIWSGAGCGKTPYQSLDQSIKKSCKTRENIQRIEMVWIWFDISYETRGLEYHTIKKEFQNQGLIWFDHVWSCLIHMIKKHKCLIDVDSPWHKPSFPEQRRLSSWGETAGGAPRRTNIPCLDSRWEFGAPQAPRRPVSRCDFGKSVPDFRQFTVTLENHSRLRQFWQFSELFMFRTLLKNVGTNDIK